MNKEPGHDLLLLSLQVAVPLLIDELQGLRGDTRREQIRAWANAAVEPIAAEADVLLFGGKDTGQIPRVFNAVARGLAALAHAPGGVTFAELHFEAPCGGCSDTTPEPCRAHRPEGVA